jgi:hypothetical protein
MDRGPAAGHRVNGEEGPRAGHKTGNCRLPEVGRELAERDHHRRSPRVDTEQTGTGEGRGHRDRMGWEYALPGARHRRPHRRRPLGQHHGADPAPRRTAQLQAVLPMSSTTVASVIRSRCDPAAGQTLEPSSAPHPRRLGEHRRSDGRQSRPPSETPNDRTEVPALSARLRSHGWCL